MKPREKHIAVLRSVPDAELREEVEHAMEQFPDRLRQIREAGGVTMRCIEAETGIARQTLSAFERGERLPDFEKLMLLAAFHGVSVDWLVGGEWESGGIYD